MPNPYITRTQEQIEHIRECLRGDECERCHGKGTITFKGDKHATPCFKCKSTGRIPRSVRATLAFEEQLEEGYEFTQIGAHGDCMAYAWFKGHEGNRCRKLPLPLNAEVAVRKVCERCAGKGSYSTTHCQNYCYVCLAKGSLDSGLRLHTTKKPWCGQGVKAAVLFGPETEALWTADSGFYGYVASYECTVSEEEAKG